jgi:hypothetical protein
VPRKKNTEPAAAQDPAIQAAERLLVAKYGAVVSIVPGSLRPAGGRPAYGAKRTVIIKCSSCAKDRPLPTSDLFHCRRCRDCSANAKKAKKTTEARTESTVLSEPLAAVVPNGTLHRVRLHDTEETVDLDRLADLLRRGEDLLLVGTNTRLARIGDRHYIWSRDGGEHGPYRRPAVCVKAALGIWSQTKSKN